MMAKFEKLIQNLIVNESQVFPNLSKYKSKLKEPNCTQNYSYIYSTYLLASSFNIRVQSIWYCPLGEFAPG